MTLHHLKIFSGGQTGVDRAALDAALELGYPCGGWCPAGRKAEDGPIPDRYPLTELEYGGYRERTIRNLRDTDGTAIIYFSELTGGTRLTYESCVRYRVPYILLNATQHDIDGAVRQLRAFIEENAIGTLNVAGPRASGQPQAYAYTYAVVSKLLV